MEENQVTPPPLPGLTPLVNPYPDLFSNQTPAQSHAGCFCKPIFVGTFLFVVVVNIGVIIMQVLLVFFACGLLKGCY